MNIIITEHQYNLLEDEMDLDPCYEKTLKFYQSPQGIELLSLLRKQMEGLSQNPRFRLDKESRKKIKNYIKMVPQCKSKDEIGEYSRTLKNARKQGIGLRFPKSAIKANPQRFRYYTREKNK